MLFNDRERRQQTGVGTTLVRSFPAVNRPLPGRGLLTRRARSRDPDRPQVNPSCGSR